MAYLAGVWSLFGYSIAATRLAMLCLAAVTVLATFLLAIELSRGLLGYPAFTAAALLLASPLFYTQAMMAQLDMPAACLSLVTLLLYVRGRTGWAAVACVVLVLVKETGAMLPALLAWDLLRQRRWQEATLYLAPFLALLMWLLVLTQTTGNPLGDKGFAHYNVWYPLHPVRLAANVVRRIWYLFFDNLHIAGTLALVYAWRKGFYRNGPWRLLLQFFLLHVALVTVFGGAALERYLLPALPLFYIAVAAALALLPTGWAAAARVALIAGLVAGLFFNPPYPFPFENNLAVVDFVRLQQAAAENIAARRPQATVASAWPFPDALRRPEFGYVPQTVRTVTLENFHRDSVAQLAASPPDILVIYSRTWEAPDGAVHWRWVREFLQRYYNYQPQVDAVEIEQLLGMVQTARWERRGQWIEIYERSQHPSVAHDRDMFASCESFGF
jgi:hypothetical protein